MSVYSLWCFFFSSRRRHTRCLSDWSSDVCSSDLYNVTVTDDSGVSSTQPVTITVIGTNDAPVITSAQSGALTEHINVDNSGNLNTGGTITFTDVDLTDEHTVAFTPGGNNYLGTFTPTLAHDATGGSTGIVGWTFSVSDKAVDFLAAGQTLTQTYTVLVADNNGGLTTQDVTITITGTNEAPVIGGVSIGDVTEDVNVVAGNISTSGALTIADVDAGKSNFTAQASTHGSNGLGTFTLVANGAWTYTANNSQAAIQQLGAGQSLTDSFTAVSSDGTASRVVTVTIHGTNDVPVIGRVRTVDLNHDLNVLGRAAYTDGAQPFADGHAGKPHFTARARQPGSNGFGTFTHAANGAWTHTANDSLPAIQQLTAGQSLTDSFTAVSSDGTASRVVTVTIHGTDDAFVIAPGQVVDLKNEPNRTLAHPLIENDGTIQAAANNPCFVIGDITGTGLIFIANNTTLTIEGSVGSGQTVQFQIGQGVPPVLVLTDPSEFHATISGFQGRDQIDLEGMTIAQATAWVASITFVGFTGTFKFASDGHGGTLLSDPPASTTTTDASTTTADASTTTTDATVTPVAKTSTLTATKTTSSQTKATSATVTETPSSRTNVTSATVTETASSRTNATSAAAAADEAIMVALSTAVAVAVSAAASDADAGEMPRLAISGSDAAVDTSTVSGSDSFTVDAGAALKLSPLSDRMAGTLTDNGTDEGINGAPAGAVSETGAFKIDAGAALQLDGSDAVNGLVINGGTSADAINLPGDHHTITTARHVSDDGRGAKTAHESPVSATGEDTSAQSTSADHGFSVTSALTPSGSGAYSAFPFKPNVDHPATIDPGINLAFIPKDQPLQHPADNLIHIPAQRDHGADPAHPHVDGNQSANAKVAHDGGVNPGAVPSDPPTLTAPSSDLSWTHGPAAPALEPGEDISVQSTPANHGHHANADPETNSPSNAKNHPQRPADNLLHTPAQHDDNGSPAATDGAHPGRGQVDGSESASPTFAGDGSTHSAHATGEDTSVQSTPANNDHHAGADPKTNEIAKGKPPQHLADNSPYTPAQHDDNGSPAVTDGAHPGRGQVDGSESASPKFADEGSTHSAHATGNGTSVQSAPANNGHHAGADPKTNEIEIGKASRRDAEK